jgi:hypothetical protein
VFLIGAEPPGILLALFPQAAFGRRDELRAARSMHKEICHTSIHSGYGRFGRRLLFLAAMARVVRADQSEKLR